MNFIVSIDDTFKSYDFIEDILDFHTNGNKNSNIYYLESHPFILKYAQKHNLKCSQMESIENINRGFYAVIFGENQELSQKCHELHLKRGIIKSTK